MNKRAACLSALAAGALTVAGFAPLRLSLLPILTVATLIVLLRSAASRGSAFLIGYCFGIGMFVTGVSWVYVSLHDFGAMPMILAGSLTLLFCLYLALFPALAACAYRDLLIRGTPHLFCSVLALPALWTLSEWLRGWLFTGFPWIDIGYAQIPASPLAGYVPLLGIYGASYLTVACAALAALIWDAWRAARTEGKHRIARAVAPALITLFTVIVIGSALLKINWTQPQGNPISVSLLQGNIPEDMKWRPEKVVSTLNTYNELANSSSAQLIIFPETALPLYLHEVPPDYLNALAAHAKHNGGDMLVGVPERSSVDDYYNSVVSLGSAAPQTYRKSHLVPFGEFVPLKFLFGWFLEVTQIPLLDFSRGSIDQQPLSVAGQRVAINICYEDAFGAEIIRQLPQATMLANASNVAWFGHSIAPQQHLQISQARALETGRYMLRATNSGMTAIIDAHGSILNVAPEFTTMTVDGYAQGYVGTTPYVRWGDALILILCLAMTGVAGWLAWRGRCKICG